MSSDTITTDELVRLAEFCGKGEITTVGADKPGLVQVEGAYSWVAWQPHLDANQRDEMVEALYKDGYEVIQSVSPWDEPSFECEINHDGEDGMPDRQSQFSNANTPGLAFCRAALKVISLDSAPETG
ncbi:MAG: hypothetical protein O7D91_17700 [Planctomycetota bacterium]|nr:hypothetical protein [Planctomycetota bacterium]